MREVFLERMPDFEAFDSDSGTYQHNERSYKDELVAVFREHFTRDLLTAEMNPKTAAALVNAVRMVLTTKLPTWRQPQNFLGWRSFEFLKQIDTAESQIQLGTALQALLRSGFPGVQRLHQFNQFFWPFLQRFEPSGVSTTRTFPTLLLMLAGPDEDIVVRSRIFGRAGQLLLGRSILPNEPLNAESYGAVLQMAWGIREQLEQWQWHPRDMIDVQSFIWVASYREDDLGTASKEQA